MSFIWPVMLLLLLVIPVAVVLYRRLQRRRQALAAQYGSLGFIQTATGQAPGARRSIPPALFLIGIAVLIVAMARPQTEVSLPRIAGTVILAFDVSGSMAADDWPPTRIEAAKVVAREFVQRQPAGVLVGVVAFSDGGLLVQAPTSDQDALLATIGRLAPQRGTSLGQGILAALNTLAADTDQAPLRYSNRATTPTPEAQAPKTPGVIVLLTDGENTAPPEPLEIAQLAVERGVRIHTIGVGSAAGTTLHVEGFTVHTQLDEAMLQQIALATDGAYYNAQSPDDLRTIYENLDLQLTMKTEAIEVTALLAGLGIVILLIGGACSLLWFGRMP